MAAETTERMEGFIPSVMGGVGARVREKFCSSASLRVG